MRKKKNHGKKKSNKLSAVAIVVLVGILISLFIPSIGDEASSSLSDKIEIPLFTTKCSHQLIEHIGYTVSYNNNTKCPNWVAYELTDEEVDGVVERGETFCCDPLVRGAQAVDDDYRGSGWDRGHMAPAADMKWSKQAMDESFYFTNIAPQNSNLNRGVWKKLEELSRDKAELYGHVFVVSGPIFNGNGQKSIGFGKVKVPDAFFKVLMTDYKGVNRSIGFICPNKAGKKRLSEYAVSVDDVEAATNLDFFSLLPDDEEEKMEATYSAAFWGVR